MKHIVHIVEVHPLTVLPVKFIMMAHAIPTNPSTAIITPRWVMRRMGFVDKLVIPSKARASIFLRG